MRHWPTLATHILQYHAQYVLVQVLFYNPMRNECRSHIDKLSQLQHFIQKYIGHLLDLVRACALMFHHITFDRNKQKKYFLLQSLASADFFLDGLKACN